MSSSRARRLAQGAAIVLPTSGTTGHPKGAVLGLDNLIASAEGSARLLGADADDRWLLCMPLFHIGGLSILTRSALSARASCCSGDSIPNASRGRSRRKASRV